MSTPAGSPFADALAALVPAGDLARREADALSDRLTKPRGALGMLEVIGSQLSAIAGEVPPPVPEPAAVAVFAADHGVLAQGVTPWPAEVTGQMVANFVAGGAAVNVLARHTGARVVVVDVGVASPLVDELADHPDLIRGKVRAGTRDLAVEAAMTADEVQAALDLGARVAADLVAAGARCLLTGDMGIGNTTPSAALIAATTGRSADEVTGRGTGIDDQTLSRKVDAISRGLARLGPDAAPLEVLAEVGGLEHAALVGFVVGGAAARVPVIVDGVIACAALCVAAAHAPAVLDHVIAGHRSTEPGASAALAHLGLKPVVDLELRLGEGTGAVLALPTVQAAAKILREMATFDGAGVTDKGEA